MEMDSSSRSRSFDRSRDSAILKKPRLLAEDSAVNNNNKPNGGGLQRQPPVGFRQAAERDRDSSKGGGVGYQPQSLTQTQLQQQQHQELVSQYRTALAELTFNSKPIITNLTIIAGENLHAARAIAATICSNILEVPNDQKLPSLYLLDSIVKNIGRDYIKHFAARLPEVFCKAYRQVDSAIHPGMRHLFGTWKGVFPLQSLQMIEKELGFLPAANGSSAGLTTSTSESQSQRPGRSIHVNPKYLEARQRLQQSGRAKAATSNMMGNLVNSPMDTERLDRTAANITSGRQLVDPRLKMHAQRDIEGDSIPESGGAGCAGVDYGSDILGPSEANFGKLNERVGEQGSWYGPGSNTAETMSIQRNGFDIKHGIPSYSAPRSAIADVEVQPMNNLAIKRGGEVNRSWKNSEEEEYMWDDMNSRLAVPVASSSSKRDPRLQFESERSGFENLHKKLKGAQDHSSRLDRETSSESLSTEQKDQAACRQQIPLLKSQGLGLTDGVGHLGSGRNFLDHAESFPTSFGRSPTTVNALSRTSLQSPMVSSHIGNQSFGFPSNTVTAQRHAVGAVTPSANVSAHQHPSSPSFSQYQPSKPLHNKSEQDWPAAHPLPHADDKAARYQGQIHTALPSQPSQGSFQPLPQNSQLGNLQKLQPHNLRAPSSQLSLSQTKKHAPFLHALQPEAISESGQSPELPAQIYVSAKQLVNSSLDQLKSLVADIPGSSCTTNMLDADSTVFGNKSIPGGIADSSLDTEASLQPPPPSGPPNQLTSASSRLIPPFSQRKADKPPLPPGPPPSTSGTMSTQTSSMVNPVSSLLSTLVAKGIITASKSDSPSGPSTRKSQSPEKDLPIAQAVTSIGGLPLLSTSSKDDLVKATAKSTATVTPSTKVEVESLIGFEFKPDVIREMHPAVISKLIDDLPHQCNICGLRFQLQERFDRHKQWHELRNSESHAPNKALRRWYANSDDWVNGKPDLQLSNDTTELMDSSEEPFEVGGELMITADESQCVCILCGDLFEDVYCQERGKWMFKGAAYVNIADGKIGNISNGATRGPIVHANCISESSIFDLGLFNDVKMEKDI